MRRNRRVELRVLGKQNLFIVCCLFFDTNENLYTPARSIFTHCSCCQPHPYLETKDADGKTIGKTEFVCDWWIFVPKFDIYDGSGEKKYRLRPDTCIGGCCVMCRCGGKGSGGKCCRLPYIVRDPNTVSLYHCIVVVI